jgi:geranylgeranylglycerol-phosphate geranylgeranyltransferase
MKHYLTILRPLNGLMSVVAVWIGTIVAGASFIPGMNVLVGALSVFLISGGGMAINDYFDAAIDKMNKPHRPIPSGRISRGAAFAYAVSLMLIGIILSYTINMQTFILAIVATVLLIIYAAKMKKTILMGNFLVSALVAVTFVYGGMIAGDYGRLMPLALLALLSNVGREIYKTIDDAVGDRKYNVNSAAIKLGVLNARLLGNIFLTCAVIFSFLPFFLGIFGVTYLFFVVIADVAFIAAGVVPVKHSSKLIKVAMLIALVAFIAGAVRV